VSMIVLVSAQGGRVGGTLGLAGEGLSQGQNALARFLRAHHLGCAGTGIQLGMTRAGSSEVFGRRVISWSRHEAAEGIMRVRR
jgi:hypothetical protein